MKLIAPDYFQDFRCIADQCRHSCCIGWEIDIDAETMEKYRRTPGAFGKRLNAAIAQDDQGAHFVLDKQERCPMLNENGLCDLITARGEESLCQICADHPRFRNFFSHHTEIGLGLCCEAAAKIALGKIAPTSLVTLQPGNDSLTEEEQLLLNGRAQMLSMLQDRSLPLEARLDALLEMVSFPIPPLDWQAIYRRLERLSPAWDECLSLLDGAPLSQSFPLPPSLHIPLEQFGAYLLFRHLPAALEDGDAPLHTAFCVLSVRVVGWMCKAKPDCSLEDLMEFARLYSSEIEYSQENMDALLDSLYFE